MDIAKQMMLLQEFMIELNALIHVNFDSIRQYFEENKESLYAKAETLMTEILAECFHPDPVSEIDGRTIAAVFRRFDIFERYLKNETWWNVHRI